MPVPCVADERRRSGRGEHRRLVAASTTMPIHWSPHLRRACFLTQSTRVGCRTPNGESRASWHDGPRRASRTACSSEARASRAPPHRLRLLGPAHDASTPLAIPATTDGMAKTLLMPSGRQRARGRRWRGLGSAKRAARSAGRRRHRCRVPARSRGAAMRGGNVRGTRSLAVSWHS